MNVENFDANSGELVPQDSNNSETFLIEEDQQPKFNQRQVSDVIKRERERAYEKGKKEALMQLQQENTIAQQQAPSTGLGGMPQLTSEDVQRMIAEQAPQALEAQFQQLKQDHLVNTFVSKMQAAEEKYPGLEAELNKLNYNDPRMHALIELVNSYDNAGDIMKEITDYPHKLTSILADIRDQPYIAQKQMMALSDSIKQNQTAKDQEIQARDPLRQLKSSSTITSDDGQMSVKDFQRMLKKR